MEYTDPLKTSTPTLTPDQQALADNANIPAGQPGSPFGAVPMSSLGQQTPINLPPVPPTPTNGADGLVASAVTSIGATPIGTTPTETQTKANNLTEQISQLLAQDTGRAQALADAEKASGAVDLQKQLTDLNGQIGVKSAEYDKMFANLGGNGVVETSGVLAAQQAGLRLARAADIGLLTARAQATQGNLQLANETAAKAVDLKYSQIEDQLRVKQSQLALLKDTLDREYAQQNKAEERQYAEKIKALDRKYNEEQQRIADIKETEKQVSSVMAQAAKFGADPETLGRIQNSSSIADAIRNSGSYLSAEFKQQIEQQAFDNKIKLQQVALSRANLALSQAEFKFKQDQALIDQSGVPTQELMAYAQQYASTGQIPTNIPKGSFGVLADIAKSLPKENGYLVDKNTGIKSNGVNDTRQEAIVSLYDIVSKKIPVLEEKYRKIDTGPIGRLGSVFYTTQDRQDFRTARQEILNLLIKARSGAAVSEPEYNRYLNLVPGELSITGLNKIKSLGEQLKNTLDSQLQGGGLSIYGYSKVNLDGKTYTAGDILDNGQQKARVNPDGTLSLVQ